MFNKHTYNSFSYPRTYTYEHSGNFSSSFVGRPSFWEGVQYVVTDPLLRLLILVYSICSFCNGGLFLSISMLAQASGGYDMSPKDVSTRVSLLNVYICFS